MAKVIVERPRLKPGGKSPKGYVARWQRIDREEWPKAESLRLRWQSNPKHLNENLAPLKRFLASRCGRPWDDVYGEICQRINRDSAVQLHIWQHLMQFVSREAAGRGGAWFDLRGLPLRAAFFVHPRSRLLCKNDRAWRWKARKRQAPPAPPAFIPLDDRHYYRRIDGLWYEVELAPLPGSMAYVWDVVLRREMHACSRDLTTTHGGARYAVRKRQLNTKEIKKITAPPPANLPG